MVKILDGRKLSKEILADLKKKVEVGKLKLSLAIISVGKNKVSEVYLKQKKLACQNIGIDFRSYSFPRNISQKELKGKIKMIAENRKSSGIVIQLPLPFDSLTVSQLFNSIPPKKDIDCLGQVNFNSFCRGNKKVMPPVVSAVSKLFKKYKIRVKDKKVVVVGRGRLVGLPISFWLANNEARITIVDKSTKNIKVPIKKADIIISGAGQANLIKGSMIKKGAVVVDVGASTEKGMVFGDIEKDSVSRKASFLAPVPGGVGPLTVACLLENLITLNSSFTLNLVPRVGVEPT